MSGNPKEGTSRVNSLFFPADGYQHTFLKFILISLPSERVCMTEFFICMLHVHVLGYTSIVAAILRTAQEAQR
jgi:hypothetical protein